LRLDDILARDRRSVARSAIVPALVNGTADATIAPDNRPFAVMAFTISSDRITSIDVLADPDRLVTLTSRFPSRNPTG
jgi:hypothetical protein